MLHVLAGGPEDLVELGKSLTHFFVQFVADLRAVEVMLTPEIERLEAAGVGVNLRYYPMCRMKPELRRTICNDLQVGFDPEGTSEAVARALGRALGRKGKLREVASPLKRMKAIKNPVELATMSQAIARAAPAI